ncbi:uncharacterized protein LOC105843512 [Hydra vulgaris]|uniref:uncharacterized protein LOC105843512 n=1 Tax=Hydra vulgaris TaxID=6087 RepID=UPI001F5EA83D|nr:lysine histidine transporter 2-like [Hydra vulgaris]
MENENHIEKVTKTKFLIEDGENELLLPYLSKKGLSWQLAILFIVGEILGRGVVAIGDAAVNTGWWSISLMMISFFSNLFMTKILVEIITLIGEEAHKTRDPYTRAVECAFGKKAKLISTFILHSYTIFVTTVYLLLSTELLIMFFDEFVPSMTTTLGLRLWLCIVVVILIPITWLGTPNDYWVIALGASLTIICAAILVSTSLLLNPPSDISKVPVRNVTPVTFFFGMGSILFAFCGIPFLPNIQSDMKDGKLMFKSSVFSYVIVASVYIPVGILGIVLLGNNINPNVILNIVSQSLKLQNGYMKVVLKNLAYTALVLLAGHFLFAYNLIFNNLAQELEEIIKIKRVFCWQRCLLRAIFVLLTLVFAQTIPKFEIILSLAGGVLITTLSYVIPSLLYIKLIDNVSISYTCIMATICTFAAIVCFGSIYSNAIKIYNFYKNPV